MPREVKGYACKFRCGRGVTTKRATIVRHEQFCWCDPVKRTCKTCKHNSFVPADSEAHHAYYECRRDVEMPNGRIVMFDCEEHELSERFARQAAAASAQDGKEQGDG